MSDTLYIVRRESGFAGEYEIDVFADEILARQWADHIGAGVEEEPIIDRETLDSMMLVESSQSRS